MSSDSSTAPPSLVEEGGKQGVRAPPRGQDGEQGATQLLFYLLQFIKYILKCENFLNPLLG